MERDAAKKLIAEYKRACRSTVGSSVSKKIQYGPIKRDLEEKLLAALMESEGVRDISNADLVERAVRNARDHILAPRPRWAAVMTVFAVGSTVAHEICEKYGLDPDEKVELILED